MTHMQRPKRLFHGGAAGLNVGDHIHPAAAVGKQHPPSRNQPHYNPHRVYITGLRWYAELFAHLGRGDVYRVRPLGVTLPDRDAHGSYTCQTAVITHVVARHPVDLPERANILRTPKAR
jgi:hypothetical protein